MRIRLVSGIIVAPLLLLIAGCGGSGVSFETVSGKVSLDGAPLPAATLMLVPTSPPTGEDADPKAKGPFLAKTNEQGEFSIGPIGEAGGGVPPGAYKLTITTAHVEGADETTIAPPERAPQPYPSGVDFTVPDSGTTEANFDLKSK